MLYSLVAGLLGLSWTRCWGWVRGVAVAAIALAATELAYVLYHVAVVW